jgi:hypothetical protein
LTLQVKSGSFSLNNATGNQVISWATGGNWPSSATGKLALFIATGQTADGTAQHGIGMLGAAASSTQQWVLSQASDDAAAAVNSGQSARTNACIVLLSNGTPTVQAVATFVSFGAEQFTINVTTAPGVTGIQIGYVVFGGSDLTDVAVGSSTVPAVTGNQTISPTGFTGVTPDCILTAVPYQPASPTESVHSHFGLGWATRLPSTAQGVASMMEVDASTAIDTQRIFLTTMCVAGAEIAIANHVRGSLGSWDANGFTVNWADAAGAAGNIWLYVAIKGGNWQCFADTEATTNTGKATTLSGFGTDTPKGLLLIGSNGTADTATTDTANGDCLIGLGASDGTTEFAVANIQVNGAGNTANSLDKRRLAATKAISLVKTPTTTSPWATVCGEADATFQAGQVTLTWASTDGTARKFLGLAAGDTPAAGGGAVTIVSSASGGGTDAAPTVTRGTVADGDLLLLHLVTSDPTATATTPTGWTLIPSGGSQQDSAADTIGYLWSRVASGEPTSYSTTLALSAGWSLSVVALRGQDATSPINASAQSGDAAGTTHTTASITPTVNGCLIVSFFGVDGAVGSPAPYYTPGGTAVELIDFTGGSDTHQSINIETQATAAAISHSVTTGADSDSAAMFIVAVAPGAAAAGRVPSVIRPLRPPDSGMMRQWR